MRVRPIHFVPDLAEAVRFYEALGFAFTDAFAIWTLDRVERSRR